MSNKNAVQIVDEPVRKAYALRPMDKADSWIGHQLLNNKPVDGEHVFASPQTVTFHTASGKGRTMDPVTVSDSDNRPKLVGGWIRTTDPDEIEALDKYCAQFSGSFRKIYPVAG